MTNPEAYRVKSFFQSLVVSEVESTTAFLEVVADRKGDYWIGIKNTTTTVIMRLEGKTHANHCHPGLRTGIQT